MIIAKEPESFVKYVTEHTHLKGKGKAKGRVKVVEGSGIKNLKYTDPKTGKVFEIPFPEEEESSGNNKNQVTQQFLYWYLRAIYISVRYDTCPNNFPCLITTAPTPAIVVKNNGNAVAKLTPYIFIQVNSCSCFIIYVIASDTSNISYTGNCLVFCNYFNIASFGNGTHLYLPLIPFAIIQNISITKTSTTYLGISWAISVQFNYDDPFLPYTPYLINNTPGVCYGLKSNAIPAFTVVFSPQGNTTVSYTINKIYGSNAFVPPNFPANSPAFNPYNWYLIPVLVNGVAYMIMWGAYDNSAQPTVYGIMTGMSHNCAGAITAIGISVISQTPYQAPMSSNLEGVFGVVMLEAET